jgi:hypothetical protein
MVHRIRRLRPAFAMAMFATVALLPSEGNAIERVQDGTFDESTFCGVSDCTNVAWTESASPSASLIGPICAAATSSCNADGSGFVSAPHWASIARHGIQSGSSAIEQRVCVPAPPATLKFMLRFPISEAGSTVELRVKLDGTTVFGASDASGGFAAFAPVSVNVGALAGGKQTLRFEGDAVHGGAGNEFFDVDNVSLDAAAPANTFTFGGTKRNKKKGTATVTVNVPNPGEAVLSGKGVKATTVSGAGPVELLVKAQGKARKQLKQAGKAKVQPTITYTPTCGDPTTQTKKLTLKKG